MDEAAGKESEPRSNGVGSFGLALLGATVVCVVGMAFVIGMTLVIRGPLPTFCLVALFAWLLVACVRAGRRCAWNRFCGLVAGALQGITVAVAWICHELSQIHFSGF
jgi:hypothetical protein